MDAATVAAVFLAFTAGLLLGRRWGRMGARSLAPVLVACLVGGPVFAAPPEAIAAALADVRGLAADAAKYVRYLDLSHLPPADRDAAAQLLSWHLNSLSREPDIAVPRAVGGGAVLAVDLRDLGIDSRVYEKLADPEAHEPYFHVIIEEVQTYQPPPTLQQTVYQQQTGYQYPQQPAAKRTVRKSVAAPWLNAASVKELYDRTGSAVPVVRGDWFYKETAIQKGRHVGYYDLLGLGKKEADFLRLIGANAAEAKRLRLEIAASIARSGVALNNRGVTRLQALTGGYWLTADYKTSVDRQNTARLLAGDTEPPQGDASEQYGCLPNGLFAYWLQDKDGNRQDVVPPDIALDHKSTGNDRNIYAGTLSCARCHTEGLRPIDDFARSLYRGGIQLKSPDYDRFKRLRQLYLTDLPGRLAEDNGRYARAVHACNGQTVEGNAKLVGKVWAAYVDDPVTVGIAAAELGCTEATLTAKAKDYVTRGGTVDPVIAAFAQTPPIPLRREHWEEQYAQFQKLIGGVP